MNKLMECKKNDEGLVWNVQKVRGMRYVSKIEKESIIKTGRKGQNRT